MSRSFPELLDAFTATVRRGDGAAFSGLFTEDGVYDDVFYGVFKGREAIASMLEDYFHRDGENFLWRIDRGAVVKFRPRGQLSQFWSKFILDFSSSSFSDANVVSSAAISSVVARPSLP